MDQSLASHRRKASLYGAVSGIAASVLLLAALPSMRNHIGGAGPFSPFLFLLIPAAAGLGALLPRLLHWSGEDRPRALQLGGTLPWAAVLLAPALLLLPEGRFGMTGTALGPAKHAFSTAWTAGTVIFGAFLLPAAFARRGPAGVGLAAAALMLILHFAPATQPPNESDECDYVAAGLALLESGSTRIDTVTMNGRLDAFYFGAMPASWVHYERLISEGESYNRYSLRMIAYPAIIAPFLSIAERTSVPMLRWYIACLPGVIAFGFLAAAVARWQRIYPGSRAASGPLVISALPLLYYASNTQPEILMAAGAAWTGLFLDESRTRPDRARHAALTAAALPLLHERMVIFSAIFFVGALVNARSGRLGILLRALPIAFVVAFSFAAVLQFEIPDGGLHAYGRKGDFFRPPEWVDAAIAHLFLPQLGIPYYAPFVLVGIAGLRELRPRGLTPHAAAFAAYFFLIVTYPEGLDSWPHARYFVPSLPLFIPFALSGAARLEATGAGRYFLGLVLAAQAVIAIPLLGVPQLWRSINFG